MSLDEAAQLAHLQRGLVVLHAFTVSFTHSQCSLVVVTDDSVVVYLAQLQRGFVVVTDDSVAVQRCALLAGGRAWTLLGSSISLKPENCLKMATNPTCPVHAVLARFHHW